MHFIPSNFCCMLGYGFNFHKYFNFFIYAFHLFVVFVLYWVRNVEIVLSASWVSISKEKNVGAQSITLLWSAWIHY